MNAREIRQSFLGFFAGIINLISWSIAQAFLSLSSISFETLTPIYIFFLAFTPAWLLPRLFLQIDGRKTLVQVFAIILVSLFLNTGILATPFLLLGLPIISYYGDQSQENRFYRS